MSTIEVNGTEHRSVKVTISTISAVEKIQRKIYEKFNLPVDSYLEDDQIATYYGRNNLTEYHGRPSLDQRNALIAIKVLEGIKLS
jgi:hypothetical protein